MPGTWYPVSVTTGSVNYYYDTTLVRREAVAAPPSCVELKLVLLRFDLTHVYYTTPSPRIPKARSTLQQRTSFNRHVDAYET